MELGWNMSSEGAPRLIHRYICYRKSYLSWCQLSNSFGYGASDWCENFLEKTLLHHVVVQGHLTDVLTSYNFRYVGHRQKEKKKILHLKLKKAHRLTFRWS